MSYIYLAMGSLMLGVLLTFVMIFICGSLGVDINENLWVIGVPVTISVFLNILFIELFERNRRKNRRP